MKINYILAATLLTTIAFGQSDMNCHDILVEKISNQNIHICNLIDDASRMEHFGNACSDSNTIDAGQLITFPDSLSNSAFKKGTIEQCLEEFTISEKIDTCCL